MCEPFTQTGFSQFPLDARLQRAVSVAGYTDPTPVQNAAIPVALSGRDLIGAAQTGTGKTAAFVLPILQRLLTSPSRKIETRAVILTPTRELAEQIVDAIKQLSQFTKIRVAAVYGGVNISPQMRALRGGASIIVACPGRLLDHINRGTADFTNVDMLVLDEADRMLDMGFLPDVKRILGYLPKERQSMLISATFAPELNRLVAGELKNPERIEIDLSTPPATIAHVLYPCAASQKATLLRALLDQTPAQSVLIFTRTKHRANDLAAQVEAAGYSTTALHSNKSQFQRQRALSDFRSGRCQILVATDIAARGLDINTISHVINYDIPDTSEAYIHRIGRTGRATRDGEALTLVAPQDNGIVQEIEKALGISIERRKLEGFQYAEESRSFRPGVKKAQKKALPYPYPKSTFSKPRRSKTGLVDSI